MEDEDKIIQRMIEARNKSLNGPKMTPLTLIDAINIGFVQKELKSGDRVVLLPEFNKYTVPKKGQEVEVYRIIPPGNQKISPGERIECVDFTILMRDNIDGELIEFPYDSRYFKKV
jgi:hypothetical protein